MGDCDEYALEKQPVPAEDKPKKLATKVYGAVMARSLLWPGAFNFFSNGRIL
jgi:hypothetical protein